MSSTEYDAVAKSIRNFAEKELAPIAAEIDEKSRFPIELQEAFVNLGLFGVTLPATYGGAEMDMTSLALVLQETAKFSASVAVTLLVHNMGVCETLNKWGSTTLKEQHLESLATGRTLGAFALMDSLLHRGVESILMKTEAEGEGFRLKGCKLMVPNATLAGDFLVAVRLEDDSLGLLLIKRNTVGVTVKKSQGLMGLRGMGAGDVAFTECQASYGALITEGHHDFHSILFTFVNLNLGAIAVAIGIAEAALVAAEKHVAERVQFGRPLIEFESIRQMLTATSGEVSGAKQLLYNLTRAGEKRGIEHDVHIARSIGMTAGLKATKLALKLHGGYGYMRDLPLERYARDMRTLAAFVDSWDYSGLLKMKQ